MSKKKRNEPKTL